MPSFGGDAGRPKCLTSREMKRLVAFVLLVGALVAPAAQAAPAGTGGVRATALERQLLDELNALRTARGLRPLRVATGLQDAASGHSRAMLSGAFFAHESRDGTPMADRVRSSYPPRNGAWTVGENLIWASPGLGARQAINAWLGSPGHRSNMLSAGWREVGIGAVRASSPGGPFGRGTVVVVTMDFGSR